MRIIAYLSQKLSNLKRTSAYDYDALTNGIVRLIRKDLSQENANIIEKYDRMMEILKMAQWEGGAVIFHPFKFNENSRQ